MAFSIILKYRVRSIFDKRGVARQGCRAGRRRFRSAGLHNVNSAGRYINSKLVSAGRRFSAPRQARRITDPREYPA